MTLDVIIATYKPEGIQRVSQMYLPEIDGVNYIVSWQAHQGYEIPQNLKRKDIQIFRMEGKGLSRNRNNAIQNSKADIIYIADDDIEILPGAIEKIKERFSAYPDTDVATFKMKEEYRKIYPERITELSFYLPKGYHIGSVQMAFKRKIFPEYKFNESFGVNSGKFEVGEDELFHLKARAKGLKCRFFPDTIASHPHQASGRKKITDKRIILGMGAVITKSYPKTFLFRIPLKAWRLHKGGKFVFTPALYHLLLGSFKSYRVKI